MGKGGKHNKGNYIPGNGGKGTGKANGPGALESLVKGGALDSTMKMLGGIGGAAGMMGNLLLQNEDKFIAGIQAKESDNSDFLEQNEFNGVMYGFTYLKDPVTEKLRMVVLVLPYNELKQTYGKPLEVYNPSQFVQMLVAGAQQSKPKNT